VSRVRLVLDAGTVLGGAVAVLCTPERLLAVGVASDYTLAVFPGGALAIEPADERVGTVCVESSCAATVPGRTATLEGTLAERHVVAAVEPGSE